MTNNRKGKLNAVVFLDVLGFSLLTIGAIMIRFSRDELFSVLGGLVLAAGVATLSASRLLP